MHRHIHLTNRDPRRGCESPVCSSSHSCNAARCCTTPGYTVLYRCIRDESTPSCFKALYVTPRSMLTAGMQPLGVTALVTPQAQVIITCSKSHSLQPASAHPAGLGVATANSAAARNRYGQQVRKRTLLLTAPAIAPLAAATECCCTPARPPTHTTRHAPTHTHTHTRHTQTTTPSCMVPVAHTHEAAVHRQYPPAAGATKDKQSVSQAATPTPG